MSLFGANSALTFWPKQGYGVADRDHPVNQLLVEKNPFVDNPVMDDSLDNLSQILGTYFTAMTNSAMNAEYAAAQKQMDFQTAANEKAMKFSANQAEINRLFQKQSAEAAMKFEAEQAQKAMDFSVRMSDTAYQRAVADMQAAGINPILAYTQGGASAPAGIAGSGFSSSGSSASGVSSSGSKANVSSGKNADIGVYKNIFTSAAGLLSAVGNAVFSKKGR